MEIIIGEKFKTQIKSGQQWKVNTEHFMAYPELSKRKACLLFIGTKFTITHFPEWHFVTEFGKKFWVKPHEILEHCECLTIEEISIKKILETPKKVIEVKGKYKNRLTKIKK